MLTGLVFVAIFWGLGVFQIKRLAWKEALLARVERNVNAAPVPAPGADTWQRIAREFDEYRRVQLQGQFDHAKTSLVRASTALGGGYWVMTPLQTAQGQWVLVNRGFVPTDNSDQKSSIFDQPTGEQTVVGLLRMNEPGGSLLQSNAPEQDRWYSRDVVAMAAAKGLSAETVAPYFVDAVVMNQADSRTWPRPGLTVLHFNNNHLVYALTWFTLAAMTAGALGYLLVDDRRLRRLAADRRSHEYTDQP